MSGQNHHPEATRRRRSRLLPRLLLSIGTFVVTLTVAEIGFRLADWPRFPEPHSEPVRFAFADVGEGSEPFYVNQPGRITFRYDGNPRGYFDELSEVHHDVNPLGFRGPAFIQKPEGTFRVVCLGDSFTFGEGVRNEDAYPEVAARLLRKRGRQTDACNLGVGGYNTTQSLGVLQRFGFDLEPDVVVLGYTINDAEPPLFQIDPASREPVRRDREMAIESEAAPQKPPATVLYRLRLAQAVWKVFHERNLTQQTLRYYRSVNDTSAPGWIESERALRDIIATCRERGIPCIVVLFPLLYELSDVYPFRAVHERVGEVVAGAGGEFIDLLPRLAGQNPAGLIVHPTDPHPNETVHALAGELVAEKIASLLSGVQSDR
jgi:lysophospholipase L1-like esterase